MSPEVTFVGVGNRFRRDDAVGLYVIDGLREFFPSGVLHCSDGEITAMLAYFEQQTECVIIDALNANLEPGTTVELNPVEEPLTDVALRSSSHAMSIADAVEMARVLGQLPRCLRIIGIAGQDFESGEGLSPLVENAAAQVVSTLVGQYNDA